MRLTAGKGTCGTAKARAPRTRALVEGLQFWINLPKAQKKMNPEFQLAEDKEFPRLTQDGGKAIGEGAGMGEGLAHQDPHPAWFTLEVSVRPGGHFEWDLPAEHQGICVCPGRQLAGLALTMPRRPLKARWRCWARAAGITVRNEGKEPLVFMLAAGHPHQGAGHLERALRRLRPR